MTLEMIIAIVVLILLGGLVVVLSWKPRERLSGMSREEVKVRWNQIEELIRRGDEMSCKLAILEADKLLDHALKSAGFPGTTLGERLKVAAYKFPKLRNVWRAHLLRNKLVHEAHAQIFVHSARAAVGDFKKALQELGFL